MMQTEQVAAGRGSDAIGRAFILTAITTVGVGLAVAFHVQMGMPIGAATAFAATLYCGLILLHISLMRRRKIVVLERELARVAGERMQPNEGNAKRADAGWQVPEFRTLATEPSGSVWRPGPAVEPNLAAGNADFAAFGGSSADHGELQAAILARPQPDTARQQNRQGNEPPADHPVELAQRAAAVTWAGTVPPLPVQQTAFSTERAQALPEPPALDASTIHQMVRKLADEADANARAHAAPAPLRPRAVIDVPAGIDELAVQTEALSDSIQALRKTADAMRAPTAALEPARAPDAGDQTTSRSGLKARLVVLAEALTAERIDVLLEPILELKGQATRHYEVSVSLRTHDGAAFDPTEDRQLLSGTGILPLIDIAKISRIAEVARRLAERGRAGSVFTALTGESLDDDEFLTRFSDIYNDRAAITEQLVIALAQSDVRAFAPAHWSMVRDLGAVGFRFALEQVTDLDMDFDALRAAGVQFVKLDASVFLDGMPASDGALVPVADIHRFMSEKNLGLIVGHIANEAQLKRIMESGVEYGQGQLFGGPRPVKAQIFQARTAA